MRVTVSTHIAARPDVVWADVSRLATHAEWMVDAEAIEIVSATTCGVGTVMRVPTRIGPLVTEDWIIVTEWVEGRRIGVVHVGMVTGDGAFTIEVDGDGTRFTWDEQLSLPGMLKVAPIERMARIVIRAVWRRNLTRLASRFVPSTPSG